jgi:hypothetical protein
MFYSNKIFKKMSFYKNFFKVLCASSHDLDHVVKEPKLLNCGHFICKSCLLEEYRECTTCGIKIDFYEKDSKRLIKLNLNKLFKKMKEDTAEEMIRIKSIFKQCNSLCDYHVDCYSKVCLQIEMKY